MIVVVSECASGPCPDQRAHLRVLSEPLRPARGSLQPKTERREKGRPEIKLLAGPPPHWPRRDRCMLHLLHQWRPWAFSPTDFFWLFHIAPPTMLCARRRISCLGSSISRGQPQGPPASPSDPTCFFALHVSITGCLPVAFCTYKVRLGMYDLVVGLFFLQPFSVSDFSLDLSRSRSLPSPLNPPLSSPSSLLCAVILL